MTIFTWHCCGPCLVGDDVFGLDFFTVVVTAVGPVDTVLWTVATEFSLAAFANWLRFILLCPLFTLPMLWFAETGTVVTVTVPLLCTVLLLVTLPTIENVQHPEINTYAQMNAAKIENEKRKRRKKRTTMRNVRLKALCARRNNSCTRN